MPPQKAMNPGKLSRRMRVRFVGLATWAVVVLLVLVLGAINFFNTYRAKREIHAVLDAISDNGGVLPSNIRFGENSVLDAEPEQPFQTRYFSISYTADGSIESLRMDHIAAVTEEKALEYGEMIRTGTKDSGIIRRDHAYYAYRKTAASDGKTLIVVLDCTRTFSSLRIVQSSSLSFGLLCTALYVAILTVLSGRVVAPFIRNMENQRRFITNAGHELKTPLAIISANTEVIEMMNGKTEWTDSIHAQVKRLSGLVGDLIFLAKIGEQQDIVLTEVDFSGAAAEAAAAFGPLAAREEKKLSAEIAPDVTVMAEEQSLRELVNILLDNAVKYCDDGGDILIRLSRSKKKRGAVLEVSNPYADGGHTDYSRFFERFYRGDASHSSEKQGYGIGLSMAQELVKLFDGNISVSYRGGRIYFTVSL